MNASNPTLVHPIACCNFPPYFCNSTEISINLEIKVLIYMYCNVVGPVIKYFIQSPIGVDFPKVGHVYLSSTFCGIECEYMYFVKYEFVCLYTYCHSLQQLWKKFYNPRSTGIMVCWKLCVNAMYHKYGIVISFKIFHSEFS